MQRSDAETLALEALAWLASDADALLRFLSVSGLELADLRTRAGDAELLAAIMDFLLAEDALLARYCAEESIDPVTIYEARRQLPGGQTEA
jgi:hypothetical protein